MQARPRPSIFGLPPAYGAYLVVLIAAAAAYLVAGPIVASDNDLWYHLSHGRHIVEQGEAPTTSYFSFVEPERLWVDYYWLFQVTVHGLFTAAGYPALLLWRGLLFAGLLVAVTALLAHGLARRRAADAGPPPFAVALMVGLLAVHHLFKYELVRPHSVSYLMLALFLLILETRPRRIWLLPPLGVVWVNFHGVEYPVMVMVVLAYAAEVLVERWRSRRLPPDRDQMGRLAALAATLGTVFLTPHGTDLLRVPFVSTDLAAFYIEELSRPPLADYFVYRLSVHGMNMLEAFDLLFGLGLLATLAAVAARRARLAHLLMLAGALVLLTKAVRFSHEASLLVLPILARAHWPSWRLPRSTGLRPAATVVAACLLLVPFAHLASGWRARPDVYPLSQANLPVGIAAALQRWPAHGKVLNNPNVGGYLQWSLPDRYLIFMDLEIPFLFHDEDMYRAASAFFDAGALASLVDHYRPQAIAATLAADGFPELIRDHPDYVLVFFDDTGALYLDRRAFPELVQRQRLRFVDPFRLAGQRFADLGPETAGGLAAELERVLEIAPGVQSAGQALAILHNLAGRYGDALAVVDRALAADSRWARSWAVRGDALRGMDRWQDALDSYGRALDRAAGAAERRAIERSVSLCLERLGRPREAFRAFERAVGKFHVEAAYQDLYRLAVLAARVGEVERARQLLDFALWKVPAEQVEWQRRVRVARQQLAVASPPPDRSSGRRP